jgi:hypothetical protein
LSQITEKDVARNPPNSKTKKFAYRSDYANGVASPWKAAFPSSPPLGYWEAFGRKCEKLEPEDAVVNETIARRVWLSVLWDYEDYMRMGLWIPEAILEDHRKVARALGWY